MPFHISNKMCAYRTQSLQRNRKTLAAQGALRILSGTGKPKRDSLSLSDNARRFSKKSIAALIDKNANVSASELSYYFANYHNPRAILDAINFGTNVECGYNPDFKEYGVMRFDYNGSRQAVPNYAVPKINANTLPEIHAVNNALVLNNKSYYAWTTSDGKRYPWAVNNGMIGYARSESFLADNTNQRGINYKAEMGDASGILAALAQGSSPWEEIHSRKDVLATCEKVGIKPGFFSVEAGAGKHTYILRESGDVINVDNEIKNLNNINWIRTGYKEGDTFSVYGNEYAIDSSGHIHVSVDDTFTSTDVIYPAKILKNVPDNKG